jgi:lipid A ethanolaminephosphotransferase
MLFWQNRRLASHTDDCLASVSREAISHDNLFDIILGVTSVSSSQYIESRDILAKCRLGDDMLASAGQALNDGLMLNTIKHH